MSSNFKHVIWAVALAEEAFQDPCIVSREKWAPLDHSYQGTNLYALNCFLKSLFATIHQEK